MPQKCHKLLNFLLFSVSLSFPYFTTKSTVFAGQNRLPNQPNSRPKFWQRK